MIPDRDYYADKDGKLTEDASKAAIQVAVAGVLLDDRIAKRYGIADTLVSVDEPNAPPRRVTGHSEASVQIIKADEEETESDAEVEPETDEPETAVKKKGAKKK